MAHSVGVVAVAAAPAKVPPLASAKPAAAAASAAEAASHILCAGNHPGTWSTVGVATDSWLVMMLSILLRPDAGLP